ncbi:unnamed protein product [Schistosoma margrebowiei]|uniref:Uncharacterized protein n=1 Tax=Schistosoma margrebowiei TaxID=48269 RepID=A0A183MZ71_9TREM|nr:unnamed protein product [Schistosoma margrebowiei]
MNYYKASMELLMQKIENYMRSGSPQMVYPWTFTAKIRQFPYLDVYKNRPYLKFYIVGLFICVPPTIYGLYKGHEMKKARKFVNYFDPHDIPGKELASHYHHLYHHEKH